MQQQTDSGRDFDQSLPGKLWLASTNPRLRRRSSTRYHRIMSRGNTTNQINLQDKPGITDENAHKHRQARHGIELG